ncbi:hypothetical protein PLANPX_2542 [Lacipirellula parvula]|uniref:Uncharacterized protein n=1 Tax=Lacipirellula parvula TaxID=2650471 RepID=A0A5K7X8G7_9BACT|nr:hypothetical protein PLANPX_2542 [Lacipirellula parvula]
MTRIEKERKKQADVIRGDSRDSRSTPRTSLASLAVQKHLRN